MTAYAMRGNYVLQELDGVEIDGKGYSISTIRKALAERAALAAAPQPMGCGLPCGYDCNGACFDAAAPQPTPERVTCSACAGLGYFREEGRWVRECTTCTSTGFVTQPAVADREALVEVIREAKRKWYASQDGSSLEDRLASTLLARGLRLPGPETMAWAEIGRDKKPKAETVVSKAPWTVKPDQEFARVAIRVVEGGDDEH